MQPVPAQFAGRSVAETEQLREQLRAEAKRSLYFMARAVVKFKEMAPGFHGSLAGFVQGPERRKLVLAPRGHFKSSLCSIAYPVWRIVNDPNIRILLTNATATNAEHFLRRIKAVFEKNEVFRWLFPEVIPNFDKHTKWSATEMQVPRTADFPEATIETLGVGGKAASRHYNLQIKDDLVNEESAESAEGMKHVIEHHQYSEGLFDLPETGEDLVIGTRWSYSDFYEWIIQNQPHYAKYIRSAVERNAPIFPERFSLAGLAEIEATQGPYKYACQYLNNPGNSTIADFKIEWLRYYKESGDKFHYVDKDRADKLFDPHTALHIYAQVDPAITEDRTEINASRSAITVQGTDQYENIFILEAWADYVSPIKLLDKMFELHDKWNPIRWGIEAVAYQKALKPFAEERMLREFKYLNIEDVKPGKKEKDARIRALQPYFFDRRVYIRHGMTDFLQEYIKFPFSQTRDILDAFAYAPQMWTYPTSDHEKEDTQHAQRDFLSQINPITGY